MEHREPPRTAPTEDPPHFAPGEPAAARRFSRFVPSRASRRIALPRLVLAISAAAGVLGVAGVGWSHASRALQDWVHQRSEYQLEFREIALDPPPPGWYRGGTEAFLERVRAGSSREKVSSALALDLERLAADFQLDCWVKRVQRVDRSYPNRVTVRLVYREPVALVKVRDSRGEVLDEDGVLLPPADIEPDSLDALIPICQVSEPAFKPKYGETWKVAGGSSGLPEVDPNVQGAARLASFLKSSLAREGGLAALKHPTAVQVHCMGKNRLWVQCGARTLFAWREPPGGESAGQMRAEAKWALLRDWIERHKLPASGPILYLEFGKGGVRPFAAGP